MPDLGLRRMIGRDPGEIHRAATPLELFFDLCFVVAVSFASVALHHGFLEGHGLSATGAYLMVFFAIWWAWMNFTWFASAYDTDDWFYRIATLVQIAGVLVLAAGVPAASVGDYTVVTIGYLVLRIGFIGQCIRAAIADPEHRKVVLTYAIGFGVVQLGWLSRLWMGETAYLVAFFVLVVCELLVPVIAERFGHLSWHPGHIAERYGLFTLIVLGESVLASTNAVVEGVAEAEHAAPLIVLSFAALLIAFGMWWLYFLKPVYADLNDARTALVWGYGHYFVFASAAALSAGIELAIDYDLQHEAGEHAAVAGDHLVALDGVTTALLTTVPVAVFIGSVWFLMIRPLHARRLDVTLLSAAVLVLAATFTPAPIHLTAAVMVALIAVVVTLGVQHDREEAALGVTAHPTQ